jgi:hypothetical protein
MMAGDLTSGRVSVHSSGRFPDPVQVWSLRYTARPPALAERLCKRQQRILAAGMSARSLYKVVFLSQGKVYEIYARNVTQGTLFGFIEVERLVFGERSTVVIDPSEERIRNEFADVRRTYLPIHSILRIDVVEKPGISKISAAEGSNVSQFPTPIYTPAPSGDLDQ